MDTIQACSPSYLSSLSFVVQVQFRLPGLVREGGGGGGVMYIYFIYFVLIYLYFNDSYSYFLIFICVVGDVCGSGERHGMSGVECVCACVCVGGGGWGYRFYLVSILPVCGVSKCDFTVF